MHLTMLIAHPYPQKLGEIAIFSSDPSKTFLNYTFWNSFSNLATKHKNLKPQGPLWYVMLIIERLLKIGSNWFFNSWKTRFGFTWQNSINCTLIEEKCSRLSPWQRWDWNSDISGLKLNNTNGGEGEWFQEIMLKDPNYILLKVDG